jgi:hypothetical protein
MKRDHWRPRISPPTGLVLPVRVDSSGTIGPTRSQAQTPRWRRVAHGWYVDAAARPDTVEQHILEQASRLPPNGAVSGWASLRWRGAGFFDGLDMAGQRMLPVPLVMGVNGNLRPGPEVELSWEQLTPAEREMVRSLPCTTVRRSLFDEIRRAGDVRSGVVAADMAIAAGLITEEQLGEYVQLRPAWTGVPLVRKVLPLIDGLSVSPQESRLRLVWMLDAGLPRPRVNPTLVSLNGEFLGRPDLLDLESGLVGEYDGADHLVADRRRIDRAREERFRDHGLESVVVVRGELRSPDAVARRIRSGYQRARTSRRDRRWKVIDSP